MNFVKIVFAINLCINKWLCQLNNLKKRNQDTRNGGIHNLLVNSICIDVQQV